MKIIQIRFRNINSFYGEHPPIVFTDGLLGQTGLFVVAGPTGAGKSTLLDVITLALFNRVPRISETDGRGLSKEKILAEGLIINRQAANELKPFAYAEVEYELKGQAYRSRWSISKNRNGNWNDYEMEIAQLPDGKILSAKKSDVPGLNAGQIGLTYEQFIRSMVLAQGAFDKFLKASSGDRSKLLEQLTGTDIYRKLSQRAHQQSKEHDELVRDKQREVSMIRLLPDEQMAELTTGRTELEARLKVIDKQLTLYRNEAALVDSVLIATRELTAIDQKLTELAIRQVQFAPKQERLFQHARVADLAPLLSDLANAETNRQRALASQETANRRLDGLQTEQTRLLERVRQLTQLPTLAEQTFETAVAAFRDRVLDVTQHLKAEHERSIRPLQSIQGTIATASFGEFRGFGTDTIETTIVQVATRRQSIGVQLVQLESDYPQMTPERLQEEIEHTYEQATQLSALIQLQTQQQGRLTEVMELKKKEDEKRAIVQAGQPTLRQLRDTLTQLDEQKRELDQRKVRLAQEANLSELRKGLALGDPCPLCGSLEHPYAQHYVQQAGTLELHLQVLTDDITRKKREYDDLNGQLITAEAEGNRFSVQRKELHKVFADSKTRIAEQLEVMTLEPELQPNALTDLLQLTDVKRKELTHLHSLWEQEKLLDQLTSDLQTVQQSLIRVNQLKAEKIRLYAGDDIRERYIDWTTQFNRLRTDVSTQQGLLNQAVTTYTEANAQIEELLHTLQPVLSERSIVDVIAARSGLLDALTLRQLENEQRLLTDEALGLSLRREQEEANRQKATDARQTELSAEAVRQLVSDLTKEQRQKTEQVGNVKAQLLANDKDRKRQTKLTDELNRVEAEAMPWRELNRLIGSAKGDEFSRFAQGLTLAQLIGLANRRLRDLSDRYLLLKPRDGQDELYVIDQYQGGAERTVTSLSGGETFTLSLALALALSDLASQNVQIDSLFVDEGFGTLDPESLDTAIVMLEKLQQESQKTIGIISHRHEIKERISVQIQVEKGNDGNSRVRVVEL